MNPAPPIEGNWVSRRGWVKKNWLHYLACIVAPHIMLFVGLIYLTKQDINKKAMGKRICILSSIVLITGSLIYYMFFTPIFGLD